MHNLALWVAAAAVTLLAACGGGGSTTAPAPAAAQAVGSAGGLVEGAGGLRLAVPAGALAQPVALAVAPSEAGAPPLPALPAGLQLAGGVHALTPHGTRFSEPAELSAPRGEVPAGARVWLLKTNEAGTGWQQIEARVVGERVVAPITEFSHVSYAYCLSPCGVTQPPVISSPPASGAVDEGGYVLLAVDALGDAPLRYQWWRGNAPLRGETGRALVINPVALADDGMRLSVEVIDAGNRSTRSAEAVVTVRPLAPKVAQQPADVQARVGGPALFLAGTTSSLPQTLQWQRSNDAGNSWVDVSGPAGTSARLALATVALADHHAQFRLRAENSRGSVLTRAAVLSVLPRLDAPVFDGITPANSVVVGQGASFTARFSGAELVFQWEQRSANGGAWAPVPGADSATLTFATTTLADNGLHLRATATNATGSATSSLARLDVLAQPGGLPQRLAAGRAHSLGLARDGRLWGWGSNVQQQLAAGSSAVLAPAPLPRPGNVAAFAVGGDFNLALQDTGTLYAWGANRFGEAVYYDAAASVAEPQAVFGNAVSARAVAAGPRTALAMGLALPAATLTWGIGYYGDGQLAFTRDQVPVPRALPPQLAQAALGERHALGLTANGGVLAWGVNGDGRLGLGDRGARLVATPVPTLAGVVAVAVGEQHSLALNRFGQVLAWGGNTQGQLGGASTSAAADLPQLVPLPAPAAALASGRRHVLALLADGRLFAWGHADRGQVGHGVAGATEVVATPREITAGWTLPLQAVAAGEQHSLVLDGAGVVWAWGANDEGQLGDGSRADRATPAPVPGLLLGAFR